MRVASASFSRIREIQNGRESTEGASNLTEATAAVTPIFDHTHMYIRSKIATALYLEKRISVHATERRLDEKEFQTTLF